MNTKRSCEIPKEAQQEMYVPKVDNVMDIKDHPRYKEILAYAEKLKRNSKHMSKDRVRRKVAKKFNLKIV